MKGFLSMCPPNYAWYPPRQYLGDPATQSINYSRSRGDCTRRENCLRPGQRLPAVRSATMLPTTPSSSRITLSSWEQSSSSSSVLDTFTFACTRKTSGSTYGSCAPAREQNLKPCGRRAHIAYRLSLSFARTQLTRAQWNTCVKAAPLSLLVGILVHNEHEDDYNNVINSVKDKAIKPSPF